MRWRLTLFLVLANALLLGVIAWLHRADREQDQWAERALLPLETVTAADEMAFTQGTGEAVWALAATGDDWKLTAPLTWPANPFAVERLRQLLGQLTWETRFTLDEVQAAGRELADYGLDPAQATLSLTAGGQAHALRLGAPVEVGQRLYVRAPDEPAIYVVSRELRDALALDWTSYLDRQVLPLDPSAVQAVTIEGGPTNRRVRLSRATETTWQLEAPVQAPADAAAIQQALEALYQLEADDFQPAPPPEAQLDNPAWRLRFDGPVASLSLLLGQVVDPGAFPERRFAQLAGNPTTFTVPAAPFRVWLNAQESLRQARFLSFEPAAISTVEIRQGAAQLTLQQLETGQWQVLSNGGERPLLTRRADDALVRETLSGLRQLEALRFVSDAPSEADLSAYGLTDPQRVVTLRRVGDAPPLELVLGAYEAEGTLLYARSSTRPTVYLVRADILRHLSVSPLSFRHRILYQMPASAELVGLRLIDQATDASLLETSLPADTTWEIYGLQQPEPEASALEALVEQAQVFRVAQYVQNTFSDPFALDAATTIPWRFRLEIDMRLPGTPEPVLQTRSYVLTERRGGLRQYGGSAAEGVVFTLPLELIEALHPLLDAVVELDGPAALPEDLPPGQPNNPPERTPAEEAASAREPKPSH